MARVVPYLEMGGNKNNDGHYNEKSSKKIFGERMNHAEPETDGCDERILFSKTGGCHGWHEPDMLLLMNGYAASPSLSHWNNKKEGNDQKCTRDGDWQSRLGASRCMRRHASEV